LLEEKFADAGAVLDSIDREALAPEFVPLWLNSRAWALALSGEPLRAVLLARESLAASAERDVTALPEFRACQLGTSRRRVGVERTARRGHRVPPASDRARRLWR
jgi:hypothetical protein